MKLLNSSRSNRDNLSAVLKQLRLKGKACNATLSRIFDVPAGTTARHLAHLEELGLIRKAEQTENKEKNVGKPPILYEINPEAAYILAIEVNKKKIKTAALDFRASIISEEEFDIASKDQVVNQLKSIIELQLKKWPQEIPSPHCISFGLSCCISNSGKSNGTLISSNIKLNEIISKHFKLPVYCENDANLAVIAENNFGCCKDFSDIICIHDNYDIGLGIFLNNKLYRGANGLAGETTADNFYSQSEENRKLFAKLTPDEILKNYPELKIDNSDHSVLYSSLGKLADKGVVEAQKVLEAIAIQLAEQTLRNFRLFDPERIIISGNIIEAGLFFKDAFLKKLDEVNEYDKNESFELSKFVFSSLKNKVVLLGAAEMSFEYLMKECTNKL
jgi:predicted NBD/HSP70 family sugar kinase